MAEASLNGELDLAAGQALMPDTGRGIRANIAKRLVRIPGMSEWQGLGMAVAAPVDMKAERPWVVLKQTALVAALILLPLFYTLVPPLEDYPNHLARMQALATLP